VYKNGEYIAKEEGREESLGRGKGHQGMVTSSSTKGKCDRATSEKIFEMEGCNH